MAGNLLMGISQDEHKRAVFCNRRMYQTDLDSNLRTAVPPLPTSLTPESGQNMANNCLQII